MLSKEDYYNYLKQIGDLEKKMISIYGACVSLAVDEETKRFCSAILKQEKEHSELVEELMKLFSVLP